MTSNTNCCVPNCHSRKSKNPELSFHCFPKENDKRKVWQIALKIGKPISDAMKVCSRHFTQQDFFFISEATKKRRLKIGAVPNQNLPLSSVADPIRVEKKKVSALEREERYQQIKRKKTEFEATQSEEVKAQKPHLTEDHEDEDHDDQMTAAEALLLLNREVAEAEKQNASVQVCTADIMTTRFQLHGLTNEMLNSLTGLPSLQLLDVIVDHLNMLKVAQRQISLKDQVIIVFMKLKLNLSFVVLCALFNVSKTTCKSIFTSLIAKLAGLLGACIPWPTKEEIENNRPKVFKKFQSVRIVVDCTEIPICKFKCLKCKINSYSHYYGEQTVKYMVGISPGGLATYISKGYGGRASDNAIFSQSELLHMLEPHIDAVMVDKGFLIDDCCAENFVSVVRPPFLKNGKFTAKECHCTKAIASARVHVERFIQRIKIFKILHGKISVNMLPCIDQILTVTTGIANLTNPIMSEKSF